MKFEDMVWQACRSYPEHGTETEEMKEQKKKRALYFRRDAG